MTTQINPKEIWIGLIEVKPLEGCEILDDAKGAFINVVMCASSNEDFRRKSESTVAEMRLFIADRESPEPLIARRKRQGDFDEEIEDIISRSEDHPGEIVFGTFHLYDKGD